MILIFLTIAGIVLFIVNLKNDDTNSELFQFEIIFLIIIVVGLFILFNVKYIHFSADMQAKRIELQQTKETIDDFNLLIGTSVSTIDLPSQQLKRELLIKTVDYYKEAKKYNEQIYFWNTYPCLAFWVWGFSNPAKVVKNLKLVPII